MTQTGTPCAMRGSGGPNVGPLIVPAPTGAQASQRGFVLASHVLRHRFTADRGGVGKLCEIPVQPLSRSLPVSAVRRSSSSGPPALFALQGFGQLAGWGHTHACACPGGTHVGTSGSGSTVG